MGQPLPPRCAQRFQPERVLGEGGFGSVWLARQAGLDRLVAVKVIRPEVQLEGQNVERFLAEAKVTASLDHPAIVKVVDHDVEDGIPWIAYEFLPGQSLSAMIASGPLPFAAAVDVTLQIARALAAAHERGIIHRDVKADNVLDAGSGVYKLADFGIAKWTSDQAVHTKTGTLLGTPTHMAPEMLQGSPPGPQSDLYALGVMFYQALTGVLPFRHQNLGQLMTAQVMEPPVPPRQLNPALPEVADVLIARVLAKDPAARPAGALAFANELEQAKAAGAVVRAAGRVRGATGKSAAQATGASTRPVSKVSAPTAGVPVPTAGVPVATAGVAASATTAKVVAAPATGPGRAVLAAAGCALLGAGIAIGTAIAPRTRTVEVVGQSVAPSVAPATPAPVATPASPSPALNRTSLAKLEDFAKELSEGRLVNDERLCHILRDWCRLAPGLAGSPLAGATVDRFTELMVVASYNLISSRGKLKRAAASLEVDARSTLQLVQDPTLRFTVLVMQLHVRETVGAGWTDVVAAGEDAARELDRTPLAWRRSTSALRWRARLAWRMTHAYERLAKNDPAAAARFGRIVAELRLLFRDASNLYGSTIPDPDKARLRLTLSEVGDGYKIGCWLEQRPTEQAHLLLDARELVPVLDTAQVNAETPAGIREALAKFDPARGR